MYLFIGYPVNRASRNERLVSRVASRYLQRFTPWRGRAASAAALRAAAEAAFNSLPSDLQSEVENFVWGVMAGRAQPIEARADELYDYYESVRAVLRGKHGMSLILYRGEPKDKPPIKRRFMSWAGSYRLAAKFAEAKGYEVVEANVRVSDVAAVLVSPHNSAYVEYLVKDRPEYHERGEPLPLVGTYTRYFSSPEESDYEPEWFSVERANALVEGLKRAVGDAGGKVLGVNIKRDEWVKVTVQLPSSTPLTDDNAWVGGFPIENMQARAI